MRKRPIRLRFKAYLALFKHPPFIGLAVAVGLIQFFGGWGAVIFSFFGSFFMIVFLENYLKTRLL